MQNMAHIRRKIFLSRSCLSTHPQRIYHPQKNIPVKQIPKLLGIISGTLILENRGRTNYSNNSRVQDLAAINNNNTRYFFSSLPPHPQGHEPVFSGSSNLHSKPSSWVSRVLEILLNPDSNSILETSLEELCAESSLRLSPQFITHVLRTPKVQKSPKIAFRFFNWAGKQQGFDHELASYVAVIDSLGAVKDVDSIRAVAPALKAKIFENHENVEDTKNSGNLENGENPKSKLELYACNILMKNFGRTGMVEEAWDIWHAMKENGIKPEIFTYNCLIDALVNGDCVERAERILEMMIEEGRVGCRVGPDVVTYNMIIKGVCKAGRLEAAMDYLRQMEVNQCFPDQITYLTLMQAFHAEGRFEQTLSLFQEMPDRKLAIPSHAYNLVICGLCNEGRPYEGNKLLGDMLRKECKPNLAIYTTLIDSFFKVGDKENALKLLEQVQERGYKLDKFTCSTVVNGLCKVGEVEQAWDFLERSQVLGLDVNAFSYSAIIDGLSKAGKIGEAEKVFRAMSERGCAGDVCCFNAIIDGLCKAAELQKAMRILCRMEREGCEPTVYTYTILIDGHFKVRNSEAALKLWDEMIDRGISPTAVSFRTLSTGLCLSGNVTRACRILDELATMGVVPDTAYADMIKVLCKAGRVKQACKLADGIIDRGREVPGKLRCAFINALRKAGKADLAFKMVHSRIGIGYNRSGRIKRRIKFRTLVEPDR
ncbi:pentatricopeptide repeat-containing protein At1g03560, mitochondrial [Cryptomeria japonica]|uniref:pentatricopeptide repeat-containing protein At1g03560, mitochondrial n=1 Tax=Cryptomeria japonica TaxID=3369 RepID=UPI0025AC2C0E|nr:pentatricopeptide repeat-containing protein At1g03560, mitochondrial [Cryptomeria japonica]XP_057831704.1 pentatricopeptide repeat-containing protein At1g03560, mitochondrial [Cryptomeria japonica]XP_057831707.1 pentatricopeptide repeat-containing protein At1g03560, mitochondrial [Cryptomeria japonica]XP_057831712.1 pentatricopeptide repeat-containing protein At1g03560, mitochondrial [Cryptomeria japonica]XP_057831717.1 pentatricopeptide repeat-containing protein At1g03560, mitochondrial [Cr